MLREIIVFTLATLISHMGIANPTGKPVKAAPSSSTAQASTAKATPFLPKIPAKKDLSRKIVVGKVESTNINLDSVSVTGERIATGGSGVGAIKGDPNFDLIQIRRDWRSEMQKAEVPYHQ